MLASFTTINNISNAMQVKKNPLLLPWFCEFMKKTQLHSFDFTLELNYRNGCETTIITKKEKKELFPFCFLCHVENKTESFYWETRDLLVLFKRLVYIHGKFQRLVSFVKHWQFYTSKRSYMCTEGLSKREGINDHPK